MARGAIISMVVVVLILPSMFMVFDKVIVKTSRGFLAKTEKMEKNESKQKGSMKEKVCRSRAAEKIAGGMR